MQPTKLLIFGNPKAGTPLMIASPSVAIDLPLKVLVSENADGTVWVQDELSSYLGATSFSRRNWCRISWSSRRWRQKRRSRIRASSLAADERRTGRHMLSGGAQFRVVPTM